MSQNRVKASLALSKLTETNSCQYIVNIQDVKELKLADKQLNVLHINIRSLAKHKDELLMLLDDLAQHMVTIDVILLCETYLTSVTCDSIKIPNYVGYHKCRIGTGGGVSVFVKNNLTVSAELDTMFTENFESIFLKIKIGKTYYCVGEVYRVPNSSMTIFNNQMNDLLKSLKSDNVIIGTDQNVNLMHIDTFKPASDLIENILANKFVATITLPTRVTYVTSTLIDNIYVKLKSFKRTNSVVIRNDMTDHYPCLTCIELSDITVKGSNLVTKRVLNDSVTFNINNYLLHYDWNSIYSLDANSSYEYLLSVIQSAIDIFAPIKQYRDSARVSFTEPWMTVQLLKYNRKCQHLCTRAKLSLDETHVKKYHDYRKTLFRLKKSIKYNFYKTLFDKIGNNTKTLWSVLNGLIGKTNNKLEIPEIVTPTGTVTEMGKIPTVINNHFVNAGKKTRSKIANSNLNPLDYVSACKGTLENIKVSEEELLYIVKKLKNKKSCGHDGLSNEFVKSIFSSIVQPYCYCVNRSFIECHFPDAMKLAKVNPLLKGGCSSNCDNLRPISLLPVLSKIIEKVVFKRTVKHLEKHDILYGKQFGFRKNHSTSDAIQLLLGELISLQDVGMKVLAIFVDLKKAFDTVDHEIILGKLLKLGIKSDLHEWYRSYLHNRKQYSVLNDIKSAPKPLEIGVPQGSLLGVLLFQLLINDMKAAIKFSNSILYADDTTIFVCGKNLKFAKTKLQADINNVYGWMCANKLSFNVDKTKMMIFSTSPYVEDVSITVGSQQIELVSEFKFLGFIVDQSLTMHSHVNYLHMKLLKVIYLLNKLKDFVPTGLLRNLYYAHFHSRLTYSLGSWGNLTSKADHTKLFRLQKRIIRTITKSSYYEHTGPLFKKLNIPTLEDEIKLANLRLAHRLFNEAMPKPLRNLFVMSKSSISTRNRNMLILDHKSTKYNKSFLVKSIVLWNQETPEHKQIKSVKTFLKKVKHRIITKY